MTSARFSLCARSFRWVTLVAVILGSGSVAQCQTPDEFDPGANGYVTALALQANGNVLVGGNFTVLGGVARINLGRLFPDGSLDRTFDPAPNGAVSCLAVQPDGKILVGGYFQQLCGQPRECLGRLNADGTLDAGFHPVLTDLSPSPCVLSLVVQPDGKILVAGVFTTIDFTARKSLARLKADGTLDLPYNPNPNGVVSFQALQPDGKIVVGGDFTSIALSWQTNLGRLNGLGMYDRTFNPVINELPRCLLLQPDGKIVVGGGAAYLFGTGTNLWRLNPNGTRDSAFGARGNDRVSLLALQADGMILAGGPFTSFGGLLRTNVGRVKADSTVDASFNARVSGPYAPWGLVGALALQEDGKIIVGGSFTSIGGMPRAGIARLNNTTAAGRWLCFDGSTITWFRSGSSPEFWRTTFESSSNGVNWVNLGSGTRVQGGWQLSGVKVSLRSLIRARGFVVGGCEGGGSWHAEQIARQPAILIDADFGSRSGVFGFNMVSDVGRYLVVDASSDLVNWVPVATNAVAPTPTWFRDPESPGLLSRFYRVRAE